MIPPISLTDFVDFVAASGIPKMTKVREIKHRPPYERPFDYWRILRQGIEDFHIQKHKDKKKYFDDLLEAMKNGAKCEGYRPLVANYKGYLGKKSFVVVPRTRHMSWKRGELTVRVNPELRVNVNEKPHLIKLYFKSLPLSSSKVQIILLLMKRATPRLEEPVLYCLNDVHHNKQYVNENPNDDLLPLLYGEADSFQTIWNNIK
jgi:hypothetical protein